MSAYINLETNEYPCRQGDIRLLYPNMGEEFVCPDEYALVKEVPMPISEDEYFKYVEGAPKKTETGWLQQWDLVPVSDIEKLMLDTRPKNYVPNEFIWDIFENKWITLDEHFANVDKRREELKIPVVSDSPAVTTISLE